MGLGGEFERLVPTKLTSYTMKMALLLLAAGALTGIVVPYWLRDFIGGAGVNFASLSFAIDLPLVCRVIGVGLMASALIWMILIMLGHE